MDDSINLRVMKETKDSVKNICKKDKTNISDVLRERVEQIIELGSTKVIQNHQEHNSFQFVFEKLQSENNNIINLLQSQLETKDKQLETKDEQLKSKDKLLENMQVLLKEEQSKNILLLEDKNSQSKTSWFSFFNKKKKSVQI